MIGDKYLLYVVVLVEKATVMQSTYVEAKPLVVFSTIKAAPRSNIKKIKY
jgi:hypothetical protein